MGVEKKARTNVQKMRKKVDHELGPQIFLMERKRLMLRVGYDGVKMEEKLIQSNSMKPTGSIRSSLNHSDLTSTNPS